MKWIVPLLLMASIALAGCSKTDSHPLDPYVMDVLETPDACYHIDLKKDEEAAQLAAFAGITSNPGTIGNGLLTIDGHAPEDNRYAFFECRFSDGVYRFASGAMEFASAADAEAYVQAAAEKAGFVSCVGQADIFRDGDTLGAVVSLSEKEAWHPLFAEKKDDFLQERYAKGAIDQCAALGR